MTNPKLIATPFAENGDKNSIPETNTDPMNPQLASMSDGFPPITQQKISEGGIPPERDDFNGILNLYGQHLVHLNKGLPYEFDQDFANLIGGYPLNARLMLSNGDIVQSEIANNVNNPNNNMSGWINPKIPASSVIDNSGKTQQQINDLISSEGVNLLSFYTNDFGLALVNAVNYAQQNNVRNIYIPTFTYSAKTSAIFSLTANLTITFGASVIVNVENEIHVIDVNQSDKMLIVNGNLASFVPVWTVNSSTPSSVIKIKSNTLTRSGIYSNLCSIKNNNAYFKYGIYSFGLNYSIINSCQFWAAYPIWNETNTDYGHSMGCFVHDCFLSAANDSVTLVNNGDLGCEGWTFSGGEYFGTYGCIVTIDNLNSTNYIAPLLHAINVHMSARRFFRLSAVGRVIISGCDLQAQITTDTSYKALIELDGVQVFSLTGGTVVSQAPEGGSEPFDSKPLINFADSPKGRKSAYVEIDGAQLWLYQVAPLVIFESNSNYIGTVNISGVNTASFTGKFCNSGYEKYISLDVNTKLYDSNISASLYTGSGSFDLSSGILTLSEASIGNYYSISDSIVPNGSTIKKIVANGSIGKQFSIKFDANNLAILHSSSINIIGGEPIFLPYNGSVMQFIGINSSIVIVKDVPTTGYLDRKGIIPPSTGSSGVSGQKIYSGGFVYEYFYGTGWVRYSASTF